MGSVSAIVLGLVAFTPLSGLYFQGLVGVSGELAAIATAGAQFGIIVPLLMALQSWFRGWLTAQRVTVPLTVSMLANLAAMAVVLALGVTLGMPGVPLAATAMTAAMVIEVLVLGAVARRLAG